MGSHRQHSRTSSCSSRCESGTPGRILALFALTLLPYSLLSPFMGVFVDRWPRRGLLVWTNVIRAALLASRSRCGRKRSPVTPSCCVSLLLILAFGRLFLTTKGALLPAVLHDHHLLRGNALSAGGGMVAALAGGAVGVGLAGLAPDIAPFIAAGVVLRRRCLALEPAVTSHSTIDSLTRGRLTDAATADLSGARRRAASHLGPTPVRAFH